MSYEIYETLKKQIESGFEGYRKSNPFYKSIFDGSIKKDVFVNFLANTSYMTSQTPNHLRLAVREAEKRNMTKLRDFFKLKIQEETGHEVWGKNDVENISGKGAEIANRENISVGMKNLLSSNEEMIKENPYNYFIYILFAEYYTVLAGPPCMAEVEKACGIPIAHQSIIAEHAELDKDHVQNWAKEASELGDHGLSMDHYQNVMSKMIANHDRFTSGLMI